jgi:hypothetical protein
VESGAQPVDELVKIPVTTISEWLENLQSLERNWTKWRSTFITLLLSLASLGILDHIYGDTPALSGLRVAVSSIVILTASYSLGTAYHNALTLGRILDSGQRIRLIVGAALLEKSYTLLSSLSLLAEKGERERRIKLLARAVNSLQAKYYPLPEEVKSSGEVKPQLCELGSPADSPPAESKKRGQWP